MTPERGRLGQGALALAAGPSSWDEIGRRTVELYRRLLGESVPPALRR